MTYRERKWLIVTSIIILICMILSSGCNANGGLVNPLEGVKLNMNIPITKAPQPYIDLHATTAISVETSNVSVIPTPTSQYVFKYE